MTFNLLILGKSGRTLCGKFEMCGGTRVRCAAVEDDYGEDFEGLKIAARTAEKDLQGKVDAVLLTWDLASEQSTQLFFSMTESFRTYRERTFVCLLNGTKEEVFKQCANQNDHCGNWEMQSAVVFFADRFVDVENAGTALKSMLKRRLVGPPIQVDILATDDFIRGAIARRDARKRLFLDASKDEFARKTLEKRFKTRMADTMRYVGERILI
jgi:hypothetical protein